MSYEDLLGEITKELPHLKDQLSTPSVVFVREFNKVYITFQSKVLVEEKTFMKMKA